MFKSILFIYLELFTIRNLRNYKKFVIKTSRDYITSFIAQSDNYKDFRLDCYFYSTMLNPSEFRFVSDFLRYLREVDKKIKI